MYKKSKKNSVSQKTDSYLAGDFPTANSNEFVPKPLDDVKHSSECDTAEIFDFIPHIKDEKYKRKRP